eukprot:6046894-Alexandrium_andersonii.AAC.1
MHTECVYLIMLWLFACTAPADKIPTPLSPSRNQSTDAKDSELGQLRTKFRRLRVADVERVAIELDEMDSQR